MVWYHICTTAFPNGDPPWHKQADPDDIQRLIAAAAAGFLGATRCLVACIFTARRSVGGDCLFTCFEVRKIRKRLPGTVKCDGCICFMVDSTPIQRSNIYYIYYNITCGMVV